MIETVAGSEEAEAKFCHIRRQRVVLVRLKELFCLKKNEMEEDTFSLQTFILGKSSVHQTDLLFAWKKHLCVDKDIESHLAHPFEKLLKRFVIQDGNQD